jgi:hypothetical protein
LLETSFSNNYAVYKNEVMANEETFENNSLSFRELIFSLEEDDDTYVYEIGLPMLIMLCFTVSTIRRLEPKIKKEYIFYLILGLISCFMATKYFPWKYLWKYIRFLQFPYRFLEIASFCFAIVCSINMGIVIKNFNFKDALVLAIISVIYVCALSNRIPRNDNFSYDFKTDFLSSIGFVTGRNTDCLVGMGKSEYLPEKAYNNEFYVASRESDEILILKGSGEVSNVQKSGNTLTGKIESAENDTVFEFPYVYYPGFSVKIDGQEVASFEDENGFL